MFNKKLNHIKEVDVLLSILLLAYTLVRAQVLSLTIDEASTFFNLVEIRNYAQYFFDAKAFGTANNHILNSVCAKLGYQFFGIGTLQLRWASVLMHGFYLFYSLRIVRLLQPQHRLAALALFCLLNLNPYILDFFSLARGYAWTLAATLACVYYFLKEDFTKMSVWMAIGILANFSFLNVAAVFWLTFNARFLLEKKPLTDIFKANLTPSVILLLVAALVIRPILILKDNGEFLYGAAKLTETFRSLMYSTAYHGKHLARGGVQIVGVIFIMAIGVSMGLAFRNFLKQKRDASFYLAVFPLLSVAFMVVQHFILGSKYLENRTALLFLPLLMLSLNGLLSIDNQRFRKIFAVIFSGFMVFHFLKSANLTMTYEWGYDRYNEKIASYVAERAKAEGRPLSIGSTEFLHSGLRFHVIQKNGLVNMQTWEVQFPKLRTDTFHEFYYLPVHQKAQVHPDYKVVLELGNLVLLRR